MSRLPKILVVVGPTASGKTGLSIKLAEKFNGEIVSADSCQIYRGMDIGTAKLPISHERSESVKSSTPPLLRKGGVSVREGVTHYMLDIKDPDENYTLADYKRDAIRAIHSVLKKGKLPILIGGTGLYIQAVTENLDIPAVPPNPALRQKLEQKLAKNGLAKLFEELIELDPEAAYVVDGKNPRRVLRALEVAIITGKPFTSQKRKGKKLFETLKLGLNPPDLKERISKRGKLMEKEGLVGEVKKLVKKYGINIQAFDAIGYREIIQYLKGDSTLTEAIGLMVRNTEKYAKRQLTWFRKDREINWIRNGREAEKLVKIFLE